jgi:hypothetical protein
VTIEADPRGVGEVGGELDEQRAEVLVHQAEILARLCLRPTSPSLLRCTQNLIHL